MMESLFYLSAFFGALCSGCALWGVLYREDKFIFVLGCIYGLAAVGYFLVACVAVALA